MYQSRPTGTGGGAAEVCIKETATGVIIKGVYNKSKPNGTVGTEGEGSARR